VHAAIVLDCNRPAWLLKDPYTKLPPAFSAVELLLNRMTIKQPDGSPGLLATGQFGDAVSSELRKLGLEKNVIQIINSGDQVSPLGTES
jgi:indoleamine 2,3-dioxygenase